jgi:hypothetical protein
MAALLVQRSAAVSLETTLVLTGALCFLEQQYVL